MHAFRNNINAISAFLHRGALLKVCGLLLLHVLFTGHRVAEAIDSTSAERTVSQWKETDNSPFASVLFITVQNACTDAFDFENAPEPEPEPTGESGGIDKASTQSNLSLFSFAGADYSSTKNTLAYCTASLQKRTMVPLFVLYHAWKRFLA